MNLKKPLRVAGALVLTALAAALAAPSAQAADPFRPTSIGCFTGAGVPGCATSLTQAEGLWEIEVSADGRHAYASAYNSSAVHAFTRAPSGVLTWLACYQEVPAAPCTKAWGISAPGEIELSKDGEFVYVASWLTPGGVAVFDRNPGTGLLTQFGDSSRCWSNNGSSNGVAAQCEDGRSMSGVTSMRVSPDGKHLYGTTNGGDAGVIAFEIEPLGSLDQLAGPAGCINNGATDGCADGRAMAVSNMRQMAISPDGSAVYASSGFRGVVVFQRNATTGALSQADDTGGCITFNGASGDGVKPCATDAHIGLATEAVHAAGGNVYLTHSQGVVTFGRAANGTLSFQSCINDAGSNGCANGRHVSNWGYLDHTPDGQHLIVNSASNPDGIVIYERDAQGNLSSPQSADGCVSPSGTATDGGANVPNGCRAFAPAGGWGHIEVFDDSTFYTGNWDDEALIAFKRDFYPQCAGKTVDVAHNTSKQVDLACADRNGEPITLEIVSPPVGGALGGVDQDNDRVFYNPFTGFSGADKFTYRGKSGLLTGPAATVNLNVAAPPVDNDKDGVSPPADCDDNNAAARPGATEVPGNAVDEDCLNGPQALPPGRIVSGVDYFFDARNLRFTKIGRLVVTKVPAGATVQVRCIGGKKKGCKFKSKKRKFTKAAAKFSVKRYFNFTKRVRGKKRKIVSRLKKGAQIQIRVTAPSMIGTVVTFKTRRGRTPTFTVRCLPVGSLTPKTTC